MGSDKRSRSRRKRSGSRKRSRSRRRDSSRDRQRKERKRSRSQKRSESGGRRKRASRFSDDGPPGQMPSMQPPDMNPPNMSAPNMQPPGMDAQMNRTLTNLMGSSGTGSGQIAPSGWNAIPSVAPLPSVPGPAPEILENFIQMNGIDERAAMDLRGCPGDVQIRVLDEGDLRTARNPSAAVLARVRKAQQQITMGVAFTPSGYTSGQGFQQMGMGANPGGFGGSQPQSNSNVPGPAPEVLENFIQMNGIDERAAMDLRACPGDVLLRVLDKGELRTARNPSAAVLARIREARLQIANGMGFTPSGFGSGGGDFNQMNPNSIPVGQFGGAQSNVPGPPPEAIENFIQMNGIDDRAAMDLRACPGDVQIRVLDKGELRTARNPSSAMLARIREARLQIANGVAFTPSGGSDFNPTQGFGSYGGGNSGGDFNNQGNAGFNEGFQLAQQQMQQDQQMQSMMFQQAEEQLQSGSGGPLQNRLALGDDAGGGMANIGTAPMAGFASGGGMAGMAGFAGGGGMAGFAARGGGEAKPCTGGFAGSIARSLEKSDSWGNWEKKDDWGNKSDNWKKSDSWGNSGGGGKDDLVHQIKQIQRTDPDAKERWWAYCDRELGGVKDPGRHSEETLKRFLTGAVGSASEPVRQRSDWGKDSWNKEEGRSNFMPGDWLCGACGDHQFARNERCKQCGAPKPADAGQAKPVGMSCGGGSGGSQGSGDRGGLMPGDWLCSSCGDHQFARNQQCRKCGAPKAVQAEQPSTSQRWGDQSQGNQKSWGDQSQGSSQGMSGSLMQGDWLCPACGDHQFARNERCRQCGAPRPVEGQAAQASGSWNQEDKQKTWGDASQGEPSQGSMGGCGNQGSMGGWGGCQGSMGGLDNLGSMSGMDSMSFGGGSMEELAQQGPPGLGGNPSLKLPMNLNNQEPTMEEMSGMMQSMSGGGGMQLNAMSGSGLGFGSGGGMQLSAMSGSGLGAGMASDGGMSQAMPAAADSGGGGGGLTGLRLRLQKMKEARGAPATQDAGDASQSCGWGGGGADAAVETGGGGGWAAWD